MAVNIPIYPGSASFFPGDTPYGFYDYDSTFQTEAEQVSQWVAKRLGYPVVEVELQDKNFFAAFEEAITEYANQVNTYQGRDNILNLIGFNTGSANYSNAYVEPSLKGVLRLAKSYGTETGTGGTLTYYSGSINIISGKQTYDFLTDATLETGNFSTNQFTIRRIFHMGDPALVKYFDPYLGTGLGTQQMLGEFGWGNMSTAITFTMMPLYFDALRLQAIEFNDMIRRSGYGFQLTNNRLRVLPIPLNSFKMWFHYTLDDENIIGTDAAMSAAGNHGKITNHSNVPYYNVQYKYINDIGKQWIRKYTLATAKEMLGYVRSKYSAVPFGDTEVTLNGTDLLSAAESEKSQLIEELKETLDSYSRQAQLERKVAESDSLMSQLQKVPLKFYVK